MTRRTSLNPHPSIFYPVSQGACGVWSPRSSQPLRYLGLGGESLFLWLPPFQFKFMSYIRFPWLCVHLLRLVRKGKLHQVCVAVVMPYVESKGALDWVSWKQAQRWRVAFRVYWEVLSGVLPVGRWGRQDWIDKKGTCNMVATEQLSILCGALAVR